MEIEKLTSFEKRKSTIFFAIINNFIKFGPEIDAEISKRRESFDFLESFLFEENFNDYRWRDVEEHLKSLRDLHEILLHHQSWQGSRELDPRLWEIIGVTKRVYVLLRQAQQ